MSTRMHRTSSVNWLRNHSTIRSNEIYIRRAYGPNTNLLVGLVRERGTLAHTTTAFQLQLYAHRSSDGHLWSGLRTRTVHIICCACIWLNSMPCICITIFIYLLSHYPMAPIVCNLLDYLLLFIYHSVGATDIVHTHPHPLCKYVLTHSLLPPTIILSVVNMFLIIK